MMGTCDLMSSQLRRNPASGARPRFALRTEAPALDAHTISYVEFYEEVTLGCGSALEALTPLFSALLSTLPSGLSEQQRFFCAQRATSGWVFVQKRRPWCDLGLV